MNITSRRQSYHLRKIAHSVNPSQSEDADAEVEALILRKGDAAFCHIPPRSRMPPRLTLRFKRDMDSQSSISSHCSTRHPRQRSYQERQNICLKHLRAAGSVKNPFISKS
mmetsp:Transcript_30285/g.54845  ORF Transcript_30285/g.54845 Transcript_30285/m.54845 type:complete len:110 (-) Transcript_30285:103-432(-)